MKKHDDGRKLELRRERLRQLSGLTTDDLGQIAGGTQTYAETWNQAGLAGRAYSRTCCGEY